MNKFSFVWLARFAIGLFLISPAFAWENQNDNPLPLISLKQLSQEIEAAREKFKTGYLGAIYRDKRDTNAFSNDQDAAPVVVNFHGKFHYANDGLKWRADFQGMTYRTGSDKLIPRYWLAGFDGLHHYSSDQNGYTVGRQGLYENVPPEILFWSTHGEGFAKSLANQDWKFNDQPVVDGFRCYHLTLDREFSKTRKQRQELTISPRQSFLPVVYRVLGNARRLDWSHQLFALKPSPSKLWYPTRIVRHNVYFKLTRDTRVREFDPDRKFESSYFKQQPKLGEFVRDNRSGLIHLNDPWWPESRAYLRENFDWPPVDLVPLRNAISYVDESLLASQTPPIKAAQWIQGEPTTLANRQGKVTLLRFWTASSYQPNGEQSAALNEFYRIFKPHGLEIIGICPSSTESDAAGRVLKELGIRHPTCIDTASSKGSSYGATFDAFQLKAYVSWILIDHESKIHLVKESQLATLTKELLEAAGAQDVPKVSLDFVQEPAGMSRALGNAWLKWVNAADKGAKVTGTVTLDDVPVANVEISGQLRLETSGSAHSFGATTVFPWRKKSFDARTNENGRFELSGLCKGTYELTVQTAGRTMKQKVHVATDDSLVDIAIQATP